MKKIGYLLCAVLISLTACNSKTKSKNGKMLSVTIEPQRFFLEKIVGDAYHVNVLVPPGTSPETYEPTPATMTDLGKSEMYFKVGNLGYETAWARDLARNNPDVSIVDCSKQIELIYGESENCSHHDGDHSGHSHSHAGAGDPHVWSSPKTAKLMAKNMYRALVFSNPDAVSLYKENFDALSQLIDDTDSTITQLLADIPSRSFIIYHPSLSYFARDYNLKQYSIEHEGKSPSPAQMKLLVDLAKKENIKIVFVQQGFDIKNGEVLAKEIGAKVYEINPLAYEWDKDMIRIAKIIAGKVDE